MGHHEMTRRELLKRAGLLGGAAAAGSVFPPALARAFALAQQTPTPDPLAATRAQMAATPIQQTSLANMIVMFSGPGGNVVVRNGEEGKVVVDTFVQGAFAGLKQRLDAMPGGAPIVATINTHWHFDHADNNESFRKTGSKIIAHENTRRRLSQPHDLLGMHFAPAPAAAMPTQTFVQSEHLTFELTGTEEYVDLGYIQPAHTDTDIYVYFAIGDVLHLGDTFFNGSYPFIDASTGGKINGMIAAAEKGLKMSNPTTRIVPGHGPLADRAALTRYRDMLVTVRDRVQTLKREGRTEKEAVAAKPTTEFDAAWGQGLIQPDAFVSIVYNTL
jgi:glyoxylase-like metal-dependent hydrolase (beta-lactamase superfamily II)